MTITYNKQWAHNKDRNYGGLWVPWDGRGAQEPTRATRALEGPWGGELQRGLGLG